MKDNESIDFDLSVLSLKELVDLYKKILEFQKVLDSSKIEVESKNE